MISVRLNRRKQPCFSEAILTTDLNQLSLLVTCAVETLERDLAKSTASPEVQAKQQRDLLNLKVLLSRLDDPDLFADGIKHVKFEV